MPKETFGEMNQRILDDLLRDYEIRVDEEQILFWRKPVIGSPLADMILAKNSISKAWIQSFQTGQLSEVLK